MSVKLWHCIGAGIAGFTLFLYSGALTGNASSSPGNGCATVASVQYVDGSGQVVAGPGPGIGQVRRYRAPYEGATAIIAPVGFVPAVATDRELASFGYPPRPKGGADRLAWERIWGHTLMSDPGKMCGSNKHN